MRKLMLVTAGALMLTISGVALAHGLDEGKTSKAVAGTFTAASVSDSKTRTCTTADGKTIVSTKATYTGTATGATAGDADLTGPITLDVRSTLNTTDGVGVVEGKLKIAAVGGSTVAHLAAVYSAGTIAGLASGHGQSPHAKLLGNLSASFSATGGFTNGKIGGGTAGGAAIEYGPGSCEPSKPSKPVRPAGAKVDAHGTVTALSATSITVGTLTCSIPANLAASVAGTVKLNDRAELECALVNGVNTVVQVKAKK